MAPQQSPAFDQQRAFAHRGAPPFEIGLASSDWDGRIGGVVKHVQDIEMLMFRQQQAMMQATTPSDTDSRDTDVPESDEGAEKGAPSAGSWRSSLFVRQFNKTQLCKHHMQGCCKYADACDFAHSPSELQSRPDLWKTKLCSKYSRGQCGNPVKCPYAHGYEELRSTHMFYKSATCNEWAKYGVCSRGPMCRYSHGNTGPNYPPQPALQIPAMGQRMHTPNHPPPPPPLQTQQQYNPRHHQQHGTRTRAAPNTAQAGPQVVRWPEEKMMARDVRQCHSSYAGPVKIAQLQETRQPPYQQQQLHDHEYGISMREVFGTDLMNLMDIGCTEDALDGLDKKQHLGALAPMQPPATRLLI